VNRILNFIALVFIVVAFACSQNIAQRISYKISEHPTNVKIDSAFFNGATEPSICISPVNPEIVVAGTILDRVYYSHDGGKTWTVDRINSSFGVYGDPVVRADQKGNFYYAHLSAPDRPWRDDSFLDRIVIQKSTDGGKSWSDGSYPAVRGSKDQDKQWLAVDPKTNHIYVSWTEFDKYGSKNPADKSRILFSQSLDLGESWSEPMSINQFEGGCLDDDNTTEGAVPAAGVNGEIFVAWSHGEKIYFDKSLDQGSTWLEKDIIVTDQPGGWEFDIPGINRCNGMPITEVDHSQGPYRGTIYVNWSDQRNGEEDTDIWLSKSVDTGETWSAPHRVNNDPAGHQQFFCWMDVDPSTGYIFIIFYDRRDYLDNQTDVYLAYSTDGGTSFVNKKISETPFLPNKNLFFGDYSDISAFNGQIRPIWTRMDGVMLSSWTALIEMEKINE
jgi:hypothetical protein